MAIIVFIQSAPIRSEEPPPYSWGSGNHRGRGQRKSKPLQTGKPWQDSYSEIGFLHCMTNLINLSKCTTLQKVVNSTQSRCLGSNTREILMVMKHTNIIPQIHTINRYQSIHHSIETVHTQQVPEVTLEKQVPEVTPLTSMIPIFLHQLPGAASSYAVISGIAKEKSRHLNPPTTGQF